MAKVLKKKKHCWMKIAIVIIAIFAMFNVINMLEISSISDLNKVIYEIKYTENGWIILLFVVFLFIVNIGFNPLTVGIVAYGIFTFFNKISSLKHKMHPKFTVEYFRDDLSHVSPSLASFLVNLEINLERDVPAHILKLMLDGFIKEDDNQYIITNKNKSNLLASDVKLLEYVNSNFTNNNYLNEYEKLIIEEAIAAGYIKENNRGTCFKKMIFTPLILTFISIIAMSFLPAGEITSPVVIGLFIFLIILEIFCTFWFPIGILVYVFVQLKNSSYRRTKSGNALLEQIMGLKNFLREFSNLDKSTLKELALREYYMVYAIVLEINEDIDDEVLLKIKKQMEK